MRMPNRRQVHVHVHVYMCSARLRVICSFDAVNSSTINYVLMLVSAHVHVRAHVGCIYSSASLMQTLLVLLKMVLCSNGEVK